VYRQDSPQDTRTVALRGIRGDGSFTIVDAVTGAAFGTFTAGQLRSGIDVTIPDRFAARVLLIDPAS
jgi:hypothetical protein